MFLGSIAFMWVETILWEILMKITHHPISHYLGDNRSCWYRSYTFISTDSIIYLYPLSSSHHILEFHFHTQSLEIIADFRFAEIESIVITPIDEYFEWIIMIGILQKWEENILHALTICFSYTTPIDIRSISIGKSELALTSILHALDLCIEFFSFCFREFLRVIETIETL